MAVFLFLAVVSNHPYLNRQLLIIRHDTSCITKALSRYFLEIVGIDGSDVKIKKAIALNGATNIEYVLTLFSDYHPSKCFDTIICTNVLEHMKNTSEFLCLLKSWLNKNGRLIITVPNALALHKLLAQKMGITTDLFKLTQADLDKGHYVIFDKTELEAAVIQSGFKVFYSGGILLKPFPNKIMETIPDDLIDGYYELGKDFQDLCSSLIVVADLK